MKAIYSTVLAALALGASQAALAEINIVQNTGDGATKESAVAAAQKNLEAGCRSRQGKPVAGSMQVVFVQQGSNGKFHVDASMSCDIPEKQ